MESFLTRLNRSDNAGPVPFEGGLLAAVGTPPPQLSEQIAQSAIGLATGLTAGVGFGAAGDWIRNRRGWQTYTAALAEHNAAAELAQATHAQRLATLQESYHAGGRALQAARTGLEQARAALPIAQLEAAGAARTAAPLLGCDVASDVGRSTFMRHWLHANPVAQPGEASCLTNARTVFANEAAIVAQERAMLAQAAAADRQIARTALDIARLGSPRVPTAPVSPAGIRLGESLGSNLLQGALVGTAALYADYVGLTAVQGLGYDRNSTAYRFMQPTATTVGLPVGAYLGARALSMGPSWATAAAVGGWVVGHSINLW